MKKILIADDHPLMLSGISAILSGSEYKVVARAQNGKEALDQITLSKPDILLLDFKMPLFSGLDVLRILRAKGDMRPIVLLTANLNNDALLEAIELKVNGILMKEGAETLLLTCLNVVRDGGQWIERSIMQRAIEVNIEHKNEKPDPLVGLTHRERAIAQLVSIGRQNKLIGEELGITEGTVKVVLHRIYTKLKISNRTQLAILASDKE